MFEKMGESSYLLRVCNGRGLSLNSTGALREFILPFIFCSFWVLLRHFTAFYTVPQRLSLRIWSMAPCTYKLDTGCLFWSSPVKFLEYLNSCYICCRFAAGHDTGAADRYEFTAGQTRVSLPAEVDGRRRSQPPHEGNIVCHRVFYIQQIRPVAEFGRTPHN